MKSKRVISSTCLITLSIVILILCVPQSARGWGNTWMGASLENLVNLARWKAGSLRYNAALRINNVGYDSDIYFGNTTNRVPDYTLGAGIPFRLFLPIKKKVVFDISEDPQYLFFLKTKKERALNNDFSGNLHFVFDRIYLRGEAGFLNIRQRLSPELTVPIRQKESIFGGLALWQVSKGASVALQYRSSTYRYDNPPDSSFNISETLNRREDFLNITAYLQQVSRTRFFLSGQYGSYVFAEAASSFKDSRSYGVYGGVEFLPSPEGRREDRGIQGTINLGYMRLDVLAPQTKDFSGLAGNTSVSIGVFKLTSVRGFFSRDMQFSAYSSLAYFITTNYGGGLSRLLSRRARLEYDLSFYRGAYPTELAGEGSPPQNALLRYTNHSLGLFVQLQRDLEFSLIANLSTRGGYAALPGGKHYFIGCSLIYGIPAVGVPTMANPFSR